jgi:hypothetical protein
LVQYYQKKGGFLMNLEQNKASRWRDILKEFKTSSLTINKYCEKHNLKHHQFLYWRRKLEVLEDPDLTKNPSFIKVDVSSKDLRLNHPLTIEINTIKINVPLDFDEDHLRKLIHVVKHID